MDWNERQRTSRVLPIILAEDERGGIIESAHVSHILLAYPRSFEPVMGLWPEIPMALLFSFLSTPPSPVTPMAACGGLHLGLVLQRWLTAAQWRNHAARRVRRKNPRIFAASFFFSLILCMWHRLNKLFFLNPRKSGCMWQFLAQIGLPRWLTVVVQWGSGLAKWVVPFSFSFRNLSLSWVHAWSSKLKWKFLIRNIDLAIAYKN